MEKSDIHKYSKVGKITEDVASIVNFKYTGDVYAAPGVIKHIKKRHARGHDSLSKKVIDNILPTIENVISEPDYIGNHPRKEGTSIEFVKKVDENLLVAVEADLNNNYIYVASLYPISESKLNNRINSGRLIEYK
ncbi:PBECR2 nuclease fold domain-containing protein [Clostridium sp.]|uniref:PBECR3 domain-containing polyvalent protein n=1 Tax=Clostridium sp. TaxID=1506 RepID=UPI0039F51A0B